MKLSELLSVNRLVISLDITYADKNESAFKKVF